MKQIFAWILGCILSVSAFAMPIAETQMDSPIGYWRTIDDRTKQPKAIVQITETDNHVLQGKIVHLFEKPERLCTLCQGEKHNQPMLGLIFLENMQPLKSNEWGKGSILDPKKGQVYRSKFTLTHQEQQLEVRGYLGIQLLGRTQTWERVENKDEPRLRNKKS